MRAFAPFEPAPLLAVGVSGGADSMALCLLARQWVRERDGRVIGITIDHGLRPESAEEAALVRRWLASRDIDHVTVRWSDRPEGPIDQAEARTARYRLLEQACAERRALHLLTAHCLEDQAETFLLRLSKGSGLDGLAAMPAVRELSRIRLLRPLLTFRKAELEEICRGLKQDWIEDPSNRDRRYARSRLRAVGPALAAEGLSAERLAETARRLGKGRAALDKATAKVLARAACIYPEGSAELDPAPWRTAPDDVAARALSALVRTVGGGLHPPRQARLDRTIAWVRQGMPGGRTLAGCRLMPRRRGGRTWLRIVPEVPSWDAGTPIRPGQTMWWRNQFRVRLTPQCRDGDLKVRALGSTSQGKYLRRDVGLSAEAWLPALWHGNAIQALATHDGEPSAAESDSMPLMSIAFEPGRAIGGPSFGVV